MEQATSCLRHQHGDNVPLVLLIDTVETVGSLAVIAKVNPVCRRIAPILPFNACIRCSILCRGSRPNRWT